MTTNLMTVVTTYEGIEAMSIRKRNRLARAAMGATAKRWDQRFLRRHFSRNAKFMYSFRRRRPATIRKKERLAKVGLVEDGGKLDLVHTGRLRAAMLRRNKSIRVFPKRAIVDLRGPKYFRTNYRPGRPNLAQEVTRVIPREMVDLDEQATKAMDREFRTFKSRRVKKSG